MTDSSYLIVNTHSGLELGTYEGGTEGEALDAMARDAGYSDHAAACKVAGMTDGELRVTQVG